jgi:sulfate adenylyltransferase
MISPYGEVLVNLLVDEARAIEMKATSNDYASITLDERGLCDLELLAVGGFSPLRSFLGQDDYKRVVADGHLADGTLWPVPITLSVTPGNGVEVGKPLALRDVYGNLLAFLHVEEIYTYDKSAEAQSVYGTTDALHPEVDYLNSSASHCATGRLEVIRLPPRYDFTDIRRTPSELREHFKSIGWDKIVAFQPVSPMHRADEELSKRAAERIGGGLLIQPIVGVSQIGDIDHFTRVRCYRALVDNHYEKRSVVLNLLPLARRMTGPREAVLNAIVGRNYGCSHLIVARNHDSQAEIGVELVALEPMVYVTEKKRYVPAHEVPSGTTTTAISDAQLQSDYLANGIPLPDWFTRPSVAAILNETHRPKYRQGLTIWFTGLSGSGKSTVALALVERLAEYGRKVAFLDGDEIRTHLSKGLGFSKEDRDTNINRVGYVAGLIAAAGGTTIASVVSPYRATRDKARTSSKGNFVEVFCETPLEVCEQRDVKGLYAKARNAVAEGKGMGFTGIDDPYETPLNPEVALDTSKLGVQDSADHIIKKLIELGYILPHGHQSA